MFVRTDTHGLWEEWGLLEVLPKRSLSAQTILATKSLGKPPAVCREASWFQLRFEGVGYAEIRTIDLDISETTVKSGREQSYILDYAEVDIFKTNQTI